MQVHNCRNVKFKGEFVLNNVVALRKKYKFNSGVMILIEVAKRDGLKCDTCQNSNIHFELLPETGMTMLMGNVRMTKDHDLLNSLNGSNSADNQHLLCEDCNQLRGNRFAQYKEFKDWYQSVVSSGKNPKKLVNKLNRNFSYIDFEKNGYSHRDAFVHHIGLCDTMSKYTKQKLIDHFLKHNAFRPTNDLCGFATLLSYSEKVWDDFLNELMVIIVKHRINKDVALNNKSFSVYKYKKSITKLETFLAHVNESIKIEYSERKKVANNTQEVQVTNEVLPEHGKIKSEKQFKLITISQSWIQRIKSMFQVLLPA